MIDETLQRVRAISHPPSWLSRALSGLASKRGIFHSEADLQFALAWSLQAVMPQAQVRLEAPLRGSTQRRRVDVILHQDSRTIGIELKYAKGGLRATFDGEEYILPANNPMDVAREGILLDIERIEDLVRSRRLDEGWVLALSNNSSLWEKRSHRLVNDRELDLSDGQIKSGLINWHRYGSGNDSIVKAVEIEGSYEIVWVHYSTLALPTNGEFKYLLLGCERELLSDTT